MKPIYTILIVLLGYFNAMAQTELWGMTSEGGEYGAGCIYKTDGDGNNQVVVHSFTVYKGKQPQYTNLLEAGNGKLYGMTYYGGEHSDGVLFEYDPDAREYRILINFDYSDNSKGANPSGSLIQAGNGKLYGMTSSGGSHGEGILFEYDLTSKTFSKKADFNGATVGAEPYGSLMQAANGHLYGMTYSGGTFNLGVLFEYNIAADILTKKQDFDGINKGSHPAGDLIETSGGMLYGLTNEGGVNGHGVLFGYNLTTDSLTKKADFSYTQTGAYPVGSLLEASNGKLYGMADGGANFSGTIFEFNPATDSLINRFNFNGTTGSTPYGNLIEPVAGKLYGLTSRGGNSNWGVLFEFDLSNNGFTKKADLFDYGTYGPRGSLVKAADGNLYGLSWTGGVKGEGTFFSYDFQNNIFTRQWDFGGAKEGGDPRGSLFEASNGKLYGLTIGGGRYAQGVIFEMDPLTYSFTKIFEFDGNNYGGLPSGSFVEVNGKLYALTRTGGAHNYGTIIEYDLSTDSVVKKFDFDGWSGGDSPYAGFVLGSNSKLYGMTYQGGINNLGVIFEYDPTTNTFTKKVDFDGFSRGANPTGNLVVATNGKMYGMTRNGGVNGLGTLFEYNPLTNAIVKKVDFNGSSNGANPFRSLVQANNGLLYGLTSAGGANATGALFSYNPVSDSLIKIYDFTWANGIGYTPYSTLMQAANNKLYGSTYDGGNGGQGVLFELDLNTAVINDKVAFSGSNGARPVYGPLLEVGIPVPCTPDTTVLTSLTTDSSQASTSHTLFTNASGCDSVAIQKTKYIPVLQVHEINNPSPAMLSNCNDTSGYYLDTVRVVAYVVTDGNLSEVASGVITAANGIRPFIFINDTASEGAVVPHSGLEVMGVNWNTNRATAGFTALQQGDLVEITGVVGMFANTTQFQPLNDTAITVITSTNTSFAAAQVNAAELNDTNKINILPTGEKWEGAFIELTDVEVIAVNQFSTSNGDRVVFTVADCAGNKVDVDDFFLAQHLPSWNTLNPNSPSANGSFVAPVVGTYYSSLKGVVEHSGNGCTGGTGAGYRIHPFEASHYTIGAPDSTLITQITCDPAMMGTTVQVLTGSNGCDSVVTTITTLDPGSLTSLPDKVICDGDSALVFGHYQTAAGVYRDTISNQNGCDSILECKLLVNPEYNISLPAMGICRGDSLSIFGSWRKNAGVYYDTLQTINGCDSVLSKALTIKRSDTLHLTSTTNDPGQAGVYHSPFTNQLGCDSLVIHTVTFIGLPCIVDSIVVNETTCNPALAGTNTVILNGSDGCDSVVTTITTLDPGSLTSLADKVICDGDSTLVFGHYQTSAGIYRDTLSNQNGCDSVLECKLVVNPVYNISLPGMSICQGDSLNIFGGWQSLAGIYYDTLQSARGCDSIVSKELLIRPVKTTNVNLSICDGDSAMLGGNWRTTAGIYQDIYTGPNGCDSIVNTSLIIKPVYHLTLNDSICPGDSLFAGGAWHTAAGRYTDRFIASNGCDSLVVINLYVKDSSECPTNGPLAPVLVVSGQGWHKSTVVTATNLSGHWSGVNGVLPPAATFTLPATVGQPYPWEHLGLISGADPISTGHSITYFRDTFNLSSTADLEARLQLNADDQAEVYVNGHLMASMFGMGRVNYHNPSHDAHFYGAGQVDNGYLGHDHFDFTSGNSLNTYLQPGTNEVIVVVRNLGKASNVGGFCFRMDIGSGSLPAFVKSAVANIETSFGMDIYPNPTTGLVKASLSSEISDGKLFLYDFSGKLLQQFSITRDLEIDLSTYPQGVYLVKVLAGGKAFTQKVVKE